MRHSNGRYNSYDLKDFFQPLLLLGHTLTTYFLFTKKFLVDFNFCWNKISLESSIWRISRLYDEALDCISHFPCNIFLFMVGIVFNKPRRCTSWICKVWYHTFQIDFLQQYQTEKLEDLVAETVETTSKGSKRYCDKCHQPKPDRYRASSLILKSDFFCQNPSLPKVWSVCFKNGPPRILRIWVEFRNLHSVNGFLIVLVSTTTNILCRCYCGEQFVSWQSSFSLFLGFGRFSFFP